MGRWPRTLVVLIVAFGVVLAGVIACGELLKVDERPGGSTGFDGSVATWMVAHRVAALTTAAHVLSTLGSQPVLSPIVGAVALALLARRRYVAAGSLICVWAGAALLDSLAKDIVDRPRPPTSIWLTNVDSAAFPSGHATQSLATFLAVAVLTAPWLPRRPARAAAVVLAAGVGWSRVYLGVHWATDVVAGWLLAAVWVAIVARLAMLAQTPPNQPRRALSS